VQPAVDVVAAMARLAAIARLVARAGWAASAIAARRAAGAAKAAFLAILLAGDPATDVDRTPTIPREAAPPVEPLEVLTPRQPNGPGPSTVAPRERQAA
jgi:hypothetical protein